MITLSKVRVGETDRLESVEEGWAVCGDLVPSQFVGLWVVGVGYVSLCDRPIVPPSHCVPPVPSHCVPVPSCPRPIVSPSHCVPVPSCPRPIVSPSHCVPVPFRHFPWKYFQNGCQISAFWEVFLFFLFLFFFLPSSETVFNYELLCVNLYLTSNFYDAFFENVRAPAKLFIRMYIQRTALDGLSLAQA